MACLSLEALGAQRVREGSRDCQETMERKAILEIQFKAQRAPWDPQESQEYRAPVDPQVHLAHLEVQDERAPLVDQAPRALPDPRVNQLLCLLLETLVLY